MISFDMCGSEGAYLAEGLSLGISAHAPSSKL